jgi:hypothetical protein
MPSTGVGQPLDDVALSVYPGSPRTWDVRVTEAGQLLVAPSAPESAPQNGELIALLCAGRNRDGREWHLLPRSPLLGVNGLCPPLDVCRVEFGSIITWKSFAWRVALLWTPEPREAPPELANKTCPVCSEKLGLVPVVQCVCGRWSHFENPAEPHSPDFLNCFTSTHQCPSCQRPTSLEPQMVPAPLEKLGAAGAADWDV